MCASPPYSYADFTHDANRLFDHWKAVREENIPTAEIILRFRRLFIDGNNYPEQEIIAALHRIATSRWADETSAEARAYAFNSRLNFNGIINRCFYILINYWWLHPSHMQAPIKLIHSISFDSCYPATKRETQQLRELVRKFRQTEDYEALQDRAHVAVAIKKPVDTEAEVNADTKAQLPLRRIVYRYPYLYPPFFNRFDTSESGFDAIKFQQQQQQQLFEEKLNAYLTHLIVSQKKPYLFTGENPTEMTDEQLRRVVKQFVGAAEGSYSYKKIAHKKLIQIKHTTSCQEMKQQVHSYITSTFQFSDHPQASKYNQSSHFGSWLEERLENVLQQERYEKPTGHRLIRTCCEVINCLLTSPKDPVYGQFHPVFLSLHGNFDATFTTSLLLKITLLFQDMRTYAAQLCRLLANRFAKLLNHYGTAMRDDENVRWLVECLESWQIASSLHFGQTDFSNLSKWVKQL